MFWIKTHHHLRWSSLSLLTLSSSLNITTNVTPGFFSATLRELDTDALHRLDFFPLNFKVSATKEQPNFLSCVQLSSFDLLFHQLWSGWSRYKINVARGDCVVEREWKEKVMALPSAGRCDVLCVDAKDVSWQHMYSECERLPVNTVLAHQYSRRSCFASQLLVKNKRRDLKRASLQSKHLMHVWYDFNKVQDKARTELWQSRILKGLSVKLKGEIISSLQANLPPFFFQPVPGVSSFLMSLCGAHCVFVMHELYSMKIWLAAPPSRNVSWQCGKHTHTPAPRTLMRRRENIAERHFCRGKYTTTCANITTT